MNTPLRPLLRRFGGAYTNVALIVLNTVVLLVVLEGAAAVVWRLWRPAENGRLEEAGWYYKNQAWGEGYLREANHIDNVSYVPYVLWKTEPYQGAYIHVDREGNRQTPGATCDQRAYKVFVFGGSTVWGDGVPDWGTIPAYLQAELTTPDGRPLCVRNLGQPGWVSTQNVIELLRHLQTGDVPDQAIFYDGFNEVGVIWQEGVPGEHYDVARIRNQLNRPGTSRLLMQLFLRTHLSALLERFAPSMSALQDWPHRYQQPKVNQLTSTAIVEAYLANYDAVKALANQYGFQYVFVWQPSLHYKQEPLTEQERRIVNADEAQRAGMRALLRAVYDAIKGKARGSRDHLLFFGDSFQKSAEPVYLDGVHLTHVGNEKIAARIAETLRSPGPKSR